MSETYGCGGNGEPCQPPFCPHCITPRREKRSAPNGWPDPARPGVPLNPERDGWHWLLDGNHEPYLLRWGSDNQRWGDYPGSSATDLAEFGIGYLGPCLTPAEVDARIKEARRDALIKAAARVSNYAVTAHQHGSLPIDPHECAKQVAWEITASITAMAEKGEGND